jgi:glycosyltransferase involved in cell wall biosynthesis
MRIAILMDRIPPENVGGAGKVGWSLAVGLRDAGHHVHVIAATEAQPFREQREGIETYHLHARYPLRFQAWLSLYNPQIIRPLRALLDQIRPDVVNAHNVHRDLSYASLSLAHGMGIPTVFTSHDVMPFAYGKLTHFVNPARCGVESPAQYRLPPLYNLRQMRLRYNPLRNIIINHILRHHVQMRTCVSEAHRQALEANGLPAFRVVYNGLDPQKFTASTTAVGRLRQRLDLAGRQVILFGGRITREKGSVQLLAALKRVVQRLPTVMLLLLAPISTRLDEAGVERPEFRDLRERHLCLGGWLSGEDLAAAYHLADLATLPSIIMDTAGMINLEAMAACKPVVSTCYGGSPELVADGETGYIVNPFDTAAFADRLETLLRDPDLRRKMGEAGRRRLEDRFTLARQVEAMVGIYEATASKGNP